MENLVTKTVGKENDYVAFEYTTIATRECLVDIYVDNMPCFGWQIVEKNNGIDGVTLKFKRNREIERKQELNSLQRKFELEVATIKDLEMQKTRGARVVALTVGIIGTAFMAGSVFCVTASVPLVVPCIILGAVGAIGWALPYFLYKSIKCKMTVKNSSKIDKRYDNVCETCKSAKGLWA